jgi:hypothetical protein
MKLYVFTPKFFEKQHPDLRISPEVLAAAIARYSRTDDGMERILADLSAIRDGDDKAMASRVLKFLDYGHASIGGLTGGIAGCADGVSMLLPYLVFFLQSKQDGQETSTRYCSFTTKALPDPSIFGTPEEFHDEWRAVHTLGMDISKAVCDHLDLKIQANPDLARIPAGVSEKTAERMRRNYGFDRARYTLPVAALTNFGLVMTGREWADTLKWTSAIRIPEFQEYSTRLRTALSDELPHLMKHSYETDMAKYTMEEFFDRGIEHIRRHGAPKEELADRIITSVTLPGAGFIDSESPEVLLDRCFRGKRNRYDIPKGFPEKIHVAVAWNNVAIAEARDINRQRPCKKDILLAPKGFYMAPEMRDAIKELGLDKKMEEFLDRRASLMEKLVRSQTPLSYTGLLLLGDQMPFEMHTDAAHMTYVLELRTGTGVHFRYDEHMRRAYESFATQCPAWTKHVQLGTAEPE